MKTTIMKTTELKEVVSLYLSPYLGQRPLDGTQRPTEVMPAPADDTGTHTHQERGAGPWRKGQPSWCMRKTPDQLFASDVAGTLQYLDTGGRQVGRWLGGRLHTHWSMALHQLGIGKA